jgi:hypothetical protein
MNKQLIDKEINMKNIRVMTSCILTKWMELNFKSMCEEHIYFDPIKIFDKRIIVAEVVLSLL